ncbi:MAG TPA: AAA family ATPase [Ktedonobacteraceae bacterium]|jgi:DNA-binding transcriptional ArsR family regulator|nr:AAA family ATPase [Ktedonobacteraceae bacterium]
MAIGKDMSSPYENAPIIEQAMQWILDDLLSKNRQPSPEDLEAIPQGEGTEIIQAISEAFEKNREIGAHKVWNALCKDIDERNKAASKKGNWLKELKARPVPPRDGDETASPPVKERQYPLQPLSYFKNKPKRDWGVDQIIFNRGSSIFIGDSGSGKSTFVLNMFLSRACDVYFISRPTKPAFLVWIAGESADELYPRVKAFLACHNIPEDELKNFLALDGRMPFNNVTEVLTFIEEVKEQLAEIEVTPETHSIVFVFDTYAKCTPGSDENNTQETKIITESIDSIVREFQSHVAIIHHVNAQGKIRGNGAFKASVDTVWLVTKDGANMKLHCEKMRGTREPDDFTVEVRSILIDESAISAPDSTAPVIFPSNASAESFIPKAQMQMLHLLNSKSQLTSGEWQKLCEDEHTISRPTFHRHLKLLLKEELINGPAEEDKEQGKKVYYSLSPKGVLLLG